MLSSLSSLKSTSMRRQSSTLTHLAALSLVALTVMLVLLDVRSSLTLMVAGEPTVVVHFPEKILPRLTGVVLTLLGRLPRAL
ncbi:hypothetical protein Goari_027137 [Gossypium aridum]|uniref:Uncharacterized protein n=1 Tax=Gossypium aridum TaxID=34290 RepID=A0A7J8YMI1_GOSAI|nr:hypothetical protein [Gossypium aridum]